MTQPRRGSSREIIEETNEGEETNIMATETAEKPEVNIDFPKTIGDRTFQTPAELAEYAASLSAQLKEVNPIVKATKPGRPVSLKKQVTTAVCTFINNNMDDKLSASLAELDEETIIRLTINDGVVSMPVAAKRTEGSGGNRGGRAVNVDGVDYPSAKNARDTLHPDMKEKSQNLQAVVKYLENQGHEVTVSKPTS